MTSVETILIGIAFLLVAALWVVLYPRPRLQLTERGFLDRELGLGWIGWNEIEGAYTPSVGDSLGLRLRVRPGAKLLRRLSRRKDSSATADGTFEVRLDLSETDVSPVELLQEVLSRAGRSAQTDPTHRDATCNP